MECTTKLVSECSYVMEDKCTEIKVPYCKLNTEEHCGPVEECHKTVERQCQTLPKKICTQVAVETPVITTTPLKPLVDTYEVPEEITDSYEVPVEAPRTLAKRSVKTLRKILKKLDGTEDKVEAHLDKKRTKISALIAKKEAKAFLKKKDKKVKVVHVPVQEFRTECSETTEERCVDVPQKVCTQVEKCSKSPVKTCGFKPKQHCAKFPAKKCQKVPKESCVDVPKQSCQEIPREKCLPYPEKSCEKVVVKRPREVCYPKKEY